VEVDAMTAMTTWTAEINLTETPDQTDAEVTLRMGDVKRVAHGRARRNPEDPNVPRIGEELATARALQELAGKLVEEAADILEQKLGHEVHLTV
jgi:hypothetical protein